MSPKIAIRIIFKGETPELRQKLNLPVSQKARRKKSP